MLHNMGYYFYPYLENLKKELRCYSSVFNNVVLPIYFLCIILFTLFLSIKVKHKHISTEENPQLNIFINFLNMVLHASSRTLLKHSLFLKFQFFIPFEN